MKDELIKKYVKDFDGLLKELKGVSLFQTEVVVGENAVIFVFGRIYRYLNFDDFVIGHNKDLSNKLDGCAWIDKDRKALDVEFESRSRHFIEHITKGDVKPKDYKNTLIVCWDDNWKERPSEIDVLELEPLWKQANKL
jgi:hypothetical protein